jgi:hypothetical protein
MVNLFIIRDIVSITTTKTIKIIEIVIMSSTHSHYMVIITIIYFLLKLHFITKLHCHYFTFITQHYFKQ